MAEEKVNKEVVKGAEKAKAPVKKREPIKPYVHIDVFLNTAIPMFKLSNVQVSGFKIHMNGKHYQRDERVFLEHLKKYLNIED